MQICKKGHILKKNRHLYYHTFGKIGFTHGYNFDEDLCKNCEFNGPNLNGSGPWVKGAGPWTGTLWPHSKNVLNLRKSTAGRRWNKLNVWLGCK